MTTFDCKDIKAILSGLVDDELDSHTRHMAERHLVDCKKCRDLLNEAERVSEILALDAQRQLWPEGLPAGFEEAVLKRTVYAEAYQFAGRRWTSWLGWIAAAACLLLATSIWILDRQRSFNVATMSGRNPGAPVQSSFYKPDVHAQSRVWEGGIDPVSASSNPVGRAATAGASHDSSWMRNVDAQLIQYQPSLIGERKIEISDDDADALFAASTVMQLLQSLDISNFADVDRIRQIAEYDDLLGRLSAARQHVSVEDRPMILAAESMLLRIVRGPVSHDDLVLMRDAATSMKLASQLAELANSPAIASSL
jgi:hypothetical protein